MLLKALVRINGKMVFIYKSVFQCGLNSSGSMSVNSEGFGINGGEQTNLTNVQTSRKKRSLSQLLLEPGR